MSMALLSGERQFMLHHVEYTFPRGKTNPKCFFILLCLYPNDVRFSMLIITHPPSFRKKNIEHRFNEFIPFGHYGPLQSVRTILKLSSINCSFHNSDESVIYFPTLNKYAVFVLLSSEGTVHHISLNNEKDRILTNPVLSI